MILKKVVVVSSLLFLVGCEDLNGTFNVFKNFQAITKSGTQTVTTGAYKTSLNFKRDRVIVTLKTDSGKTEFTINTPQGTRIPSNGSFEVNSAESGQPFHVLGNNRTEETRSETRRGFESCQYQDVETVCGPSGCQSIPITRWGQQYIEYYLRTVTMDLTINLKSVSSSDNLAKFSGHSAFNEKVILQKTQCY